MQTPLIRAILVISLHRICPESYPWVSPGRLEHGCHGQYKQIGEYNWNSGVNVDPQPRTPVRKQRRR